jgi:phosphocarrier protein HPr
MSKAISRRVTLVNELGMHLRAADRFVQLASKFKAEIRIQRPAIEIDGKSIMGLLSLAVSCGEEMTISAKGVDAEQAVEALAALVACGFEEGVKRA